MSMPQQSLTDLAGIQQSAAGIQMQDLINTI